MTIDRYLFLDNGGTGEDQSVQFINEILLEFFHVTSNVGRTGCDLLVVVRPDSYHLMKEKRKLFKGQEACFHEDRNAYYVAPPSWPLVIRQRLMLLKYVAEQLKTYKENEEICTQISSLLEDIDIYTSDRGEDEEFDVEIFDQLRQLSNQGIRSIVEFFSMYAWLPEHNDVRKNLTRRYLDHQPVGLIAFILNNQRLFSQSLTGFPNIFMINAPMFGDKQEIEKRSNGRFSTSHPHTYWLKYILLRYLHHLTVNEPEAVTIDEVLQVFRGNDSIEDSDGFYPQNIVRIVLGSFAQTHQTSLISVGRKINADNSNLLRTGEITLTTRGKCLIESLVIQFP